MFSQLSTVVLDLFPTKNVQEASKGDTEIKVDPFSVLPNEMTMHIAGFLRPCDVVVLKRTCKRACEFVNGNQTRLFKSLIDRLPYNGQLSAWEEIVQRCSDDERVKVQDQINWLKNLEFIDWSAFADEYVIWAEEANINLLKSVVNEILTKGALNGHRGTRAAELIFYNLPGILVYKIKEEALEHTLSTSLCTLTRQLILILMTLLLENQNEGSIARIARTIDNLILFSVAYPVPAECISFVDKLFVEIAQQEESLATIMQGEIKRRIEWFSHDLQRWERLAADHTADDEARNAARRLIGAHAPRTDALKKILETIQKE